MFISIFREVIFLLPSALLAQYPCRISREKADRVQKNSGFMVLHYAADYVEYQPVLSGLIYPDYSCYPVNTFIAKKA